MDGRRTGTHGAYERHLVTRTRFETIPITCKKHWQSWDEESRVTGFDIPAIDIYDSCITGKDKHEITPISPVSACSQDIPDIAQTQPGYRPGQDRGQRPDMTQARQATFQSLVWATIVSIAQKLSETLAANFASPSN